jgi:drug/metabolite transporter (DMT)-like permease
MNIHDNTFISRRVALLQGDRQEGIWWAGLGVLGFSFTLPATRLAAPEMGAITVGLGRAVIAAGLAGLLLWRIRAPLPTRSQIYWLCLVAFGVVLGFPLLTALALRELPASRAAVVVGAAPMLTALIAVLQSRERLPLSFWAASLTGTSLVVGYGVSTTEASVASADLLLVFGVLLVAIGYAVGGRLAVSIGGLQVVSWALVFAAPLSLLGVIVNVAYCGITIPGADALAGFLYVSVISMFFAFIAWYKGLALAGVPKASQLQLLQAPLSLLWSGIFLGEEIPASLLMVCIGALGCAFLAQRTRLPKRITR